MPKLLALLADPSSSHRRLRTMAGGSICHPVSLVDPWWRCLA
jgi:hypothetical protein